MPPTRTNKDIASDLRSAFVQLDEARKAFTYAEIRLDEAHGQVNKLIWEIQNRKEADDGADTGSGS